MSSDPRMLLVSSETVRQLSERVARLETKVDALLASQVGAHALEERVRAVELGDAAASGHRAARGKTWDFIQEILLAIIASGVWLTIGYTLWSGGGPAP
jgi:outer membrane murein-binding lipoprotein Lpp